MINAEPMAKFVAALRSGEFQQAKGTLCRIKRPDYILKAEGTSEEVLYRDDNENTLGHCCLGVASEVAVREEIISKKNIVNEGSGEIQVSYGNFSPAGFESYTFLPEPVRDWLGLPSVDPRFDLTGTKYGEMISAAEEFNGFAREQHEIAGRLVVSASVLNDKYNFTFEMIADLFESGVILDNEGKPVEREQV